MALEEFRDKWKSEVGVEKEEGNGNLASDRSMPDDDHDSDIITKVCSVCMTFLSHDN